jgi:sugar-specific transcriptional regulator TrmB
MDRYESADTADIQSVLTENVGMSEVEADVYLALIEHGKQTMAEIAGHCQASKQRVYNVADDLRDRGFIEITDDRPRKAYAIDPSTTLNPLVNRLDQVESQLAALHQRVPVDESGVSLLTNPESMAKHVRDIIRRADRSVLAMLPQELIDTFSEALSSTESVKTQLIVSNLNESDATDGEVKLPDAVAETVDYVRGVETDESIIVIGDRVEAFFWSNGAGIETPEQGFRITNPELAFQLDRFVDVAIWSIATGTKYGQQDPTFPAEYVRIRNCLADLKRATESRPVDSFEVEFTADDIETGERVTKSGVLTGYHYLPYDVRAYLEVDIYGEEGIATVGGRKVTGERYASREIQVYERGARGEPNGLDENTAAHVEACRELLPEQPGTWDIALGFDGFIDEVREMVDEREGPHEYHRLDELRELGDRISKSASSNTSFSNEWVQLDTRCGGIAAHLARAFGELGSEPTMIGTFGEPVRREFRAEFADSQLLSYGEPTLTDAVEFRDGKFMIQDTGDHATIDWKTLKEKVGLETLIEAIDGTDLLGLGYWTNIPLMPTIWDGLRTEAWPKLEDPPGSVFVDPSDVRRLSGDRLRAGIDSLDMLDDTVPVTVSANRGETLVLSNLRSEEDPERSLADGTQLAQETLGVSRFVAHSPVESVYVDDDATYRTAIPRYSNPTLTTSSGDHFNTGLMIAQLNGLPGNAQLVVANAFAGEFVRNGTPPTYDQVKQFIDTYERKFQ